MVGSPVPDERKIGGMNWGEGVAGDGRQQVREAGWRGGRMEVLLAGWEGGREGGGQEGRRTGKQEGRKAGRALGG